MGVKLEGHPENCACALCGAGPAIDTSTALSVSLTVHAARTPQEWAERLKNLFDLLFPYMEVGGVAAGHLKGAVCQGDACLFLSKTVREGIDLHPSPAWARQEVVAHPAVTVNLISVFPTALTEKTMEALVRDALSEG